MFWAASSLATFIRQQADWRRALARKFPNDSRNLPAASSLDQLAQFVERLPDSDRHLNAIVALDPFVDDQTFHAGPAALRVLSRYGYERGTPQEPRALLQDLIVALEEDRKRIAGTWRPGTGSMRFDYPKGYVATYRGDLVDVLSVVAVPQTAPEILRRPDGYIDVAIPRDFHSETVRFHIRASSPMATLRGERWVALDDLDDVPRLANAELAAPVPLSDRWAASEVDGPDTYLWNRAPSEVGVSAKFELTTRDATKRRLVGDFFEPPGGGEFRDVVVAVEPHFIPEMRFVRVVRMAAPTPDDPMVARGAAVRAYLDRCNRLGLTPSGWVNRIEPNWWGGMPFELVIQIADATGALAKDATEELWRRGYIKAGGEWVLHMDSGRGPGIAVGRGTVTRTRRRPER